MREPLRVRYCFDLPNGSQETIDLKFDVSDFRLLNTPPTEPPFWTELRFNQCANCPLNSEQHPHCPAALHMAPAVELLSALVSFDTVGVTVIQTECTLQTETTAQQAMSSVLGLIMATAGCPWIDRLRPLARFHQPFASDVETVYRSICMFLLARELLGGNNQDDASGFAALAQLADNLHVVNRDMSRRLGAAAKTDPARNAMALLDSCTTLLSAALDNSLSDLQPLFAAWRGTKF